MLAKDKDEFLVIVYLLSLSLSAPACWRTAGSAVLPIVYIMAQAFPMGPSLALQVIPTAGNQFMAVWQQSA